MNFIPTYNKFEFKLKYKIQFSSNTILNNTKKIIKNGFAW